MARRAQLKGKNPGIDENSHLWEQVATKLSSEIKMSKPGVRMPSEFVQSQRLGVSRVTVRQALTSLRERGLIESKLAR
jgi:DNA-binding GntR family transcriptional regulator